MLNAVLYLWLCLNRRRLPFSFSQTRSDWSRVSLDQFGHIERYGDFALEVLGLLKEPTHVFMVQDLCGADGAV